VLCYLLAQ